MTHYLTLVINEARLEASLINSVRDEFAAKIVKLQDAADRLDRAANWESMFPTLSLNTIKGDTYSLEKGQ
jgi:uncharacterized membrane protein